MPRLTLGERTRLARLFVDRSCRSASARLKHSPLLKWRYGAPVADKLLIVPQDLRIADPSFASEVEFGHFGLGGTVAILDGASPFDVAPPNAAWERELHGFGWLRHLDAAGHVGARDLAIALVADWCSRFRRPAAGKVAWEPAVVGRRMMSWISSASLILEVVDQATFDTTTDRLGDQLLYLAATWAHAPEGLPRIEALAGLLVGHLSISGYERHLEPVGQAFAAELNKQILPDGGHVTRNPMALVELLLDFLPLRQCFITREQKLPEGFDDTIKRMLKMLRYLRLGDGKLGRFNGMSAHMIDVLSTVLAYDDRPQEQLIAAPHSRYLRLERGPLVLLMDVGPPPPLELSGAAHAGCLSFEISDGSEAVFVNGGAPLPAAREWQSAARATASHNTLCLGCKSSARLVRHDHLETLVGGAPIRFPDDVEYRTTTRDGGVEVEAFHDGYFPRFKLLHRRRIEIDATGDRIAGVERIGPQRGQMRLSQDLPFAVHFHLASGVACAPGDSESTIILTLADGRRWRFAATGAALGIEESLHFADLAGPRAALQIVLRGATFGESEVRWEMERLP
jgi:uncharacterized heparinase superfamily protein